MRQRTSAKPLLLSACVQMILISCVSMIVIAVQFTPLWCLYILLWRLFNPLDYGLIFFFFFLKHGSNLPCFFSLTEKLKATLKVMG